MSAFSTLACHAVLQTGTHFQWKFNPDPKTLASPEICVEWPFTLVNQAFRNLYRTNKGSLVVDKPAAGYRMPFKNLKKQTDCGMNSFGVIFSSVHDRIRFLARLNLKLPQKFITRNFIDVSNLKWA